MTSPAPTPAVSTPPVLHPAQQAWVDAALGLYHEYQVQVVEAFDLCPWAKRARMDGRVQTDVCLHQQPHPAVVLQHLQRWEANPETEIGLLMFPRFTLTREELEQFATQCMAADAAQHQLTSPEFVLAAFHPEAELHLDNAERLIPFLRRTPDPTLQAVRVSALQRVRRGEISGTQFVDLQSLDLQALLTPRGPSLRERVAQSNLLTLQQHAAPVQQQLEQLRHARLCRYAALPELDPEGNAVQGAG